MIARVQILDRHGQEVAHYDLLLGVEIGMVRSDINFVERGVILRGFRFSVDVGLVDEREEILEGEDL